MRSCCRFVRSFVHSFMEMSLRNFLSADGHTGEVLLSTYFQRGLIDRSTSEYPVENIDFCTKVPSCDFGNMYIPISCLQTQFSGFFEIENRAGNSPIQPPQSRGSSAPPVCNLDVYELRTESHQQQWQDDIVDDPCIRESS